MVLWLQPSLFFLGESAWTLTPKAWLSLFYPMLIFSLPIGEVCKKILLCSLGFLLWFWIIGWYIKNISVRSPDRFWFPEERRTIELCFCCLGIIYICSSWAVVSWVCLGVYIKPLEVTKILSDDFSSIYNKHFEVSWLVSGVTQNTFTICPKCFSCNWKLKLFS